MRFFDIKNDYIKHILSVVFFAIVTLLYCSTTLQGEKIKSHDYKQFLGMSKEIVDYRAETGDEALWTNAMFGGMPAYQISVHYANNILVHIDQFFQLYLPRPIGIIFLYFIGFYFLLLVLKINPGLALIGALGFGFSSYFFIILEAGHNTKAHAIAYIAPVVASMIYCFAKEDRNIWHAIRGFFLAFLFLGLHLRANHFQITYYLLFILFFFWIYYLIRNLKEERKIEFIQNTMLFSLAGIMAILINIGNIWSTYEYSKYTIRGESDIVNESSGLDKDYATQWSYGKLETFNMLYPNLVGGASSVKWSEDSNLFQLIYKDTRKKGATTKQAKTYTNQVLKQLPAYFGPQPMTSGPVYIGAIMWLLFFIGLFVLKKPIKYVLLSLVIVSIFIAWGKNFSFLSDFLLQYLPLFNKFRTPSMALVIAQFIIPLLGIIGLNELIYSKHLSLYEKNKIILKSVGFFILLSIFFLSFKNVLFDFRFPLDGILPEAIMLELVKDRVHFFTTDVMRSTAFIFLAGILIYYIILFISSSDILKKRLSILALGCLVICDMWFVNKRYLNSEDFDLIENVEKPYILEEFDQNIIAQDTTIYRVYDKLQFGNTRASYFHHSLGGYHAAKLRTYQNLIERHINPDSPNQTVLNMLNAKYIIDLNTDGTALVKNDNMSALGNAWFVDIVRWVPNATEALSSLDNFNPKTTAIIDEIYKQEVSAVKNLIFSDTAFTVPNVELTQLSDNLINNKIIKDSPYVTLKMYQPNKLIYTSNNEYTGLVVFSEIFYPKGWKAYIDGIEVAYFPVNYLLRGLVVPSGSHEIIFEFKPKSFFVSSKITWFASFVLIIVGLVSLTYLVIARVKK